MRTRTSVDFVPAVENPVAGRGRASGPRPVRLLARHPAQPLQRAQDPALVASRTPQALPDASSTASQGRRRAQEHRRQQSRHPAAHSDRLLRTTPLRCYAQR